MNIPNFVYVISTEDGELIGATDTLPAAEAFCKNYAELGNDTVTEFVEVDPVDNWQIGPSWRAECVSVESFNFTLFVDSVPFFHVVSLGGIPSFLKRQAD